MSPRRESPKSRANRRRWADPAYKARVGAAIRRTLRQQAATPEGRARLSAISKGKPRPSTARANRQRWTDPTYRARMATLAAQRSAALPRCSRCHRSLRTHRRRCGVCHTPLCPTYASLACSKSHAAQLKMRDPAWAARVRGLAKGTTRNAAQRAHYRAGAATRNASPAYRTKLSAAAKRRSADPAWREKIRAAARRPRPKAGAAMKRRWENPEYRAARMQPNPKISAALKTRYAGPHGAAMREINSATAARVIRTLGKHHAHIDRQQHRWHMRSKLEVTIAQALDHMNVSWDYEPHVLYLSDGRRYIPDFWVKEWHCYIEVKGAGKGVFPQRLDKVDCARADGHRVLLVHNCTELARLQPR